MRKILAATVATALGLTIGGGVIPSAAQAYRDTSGYTPPPIVWGKCANAGLQMRGGECGFVTVPLDYAKPRGATIKLAISRIRSQSPAAEYQGVMLTNPGGPGASGLTLSVLGSFVPGTSAYDYDWIGFDPRGVGSSVPSLTCDGEYAGYNRPSYVPVNRALQRTWLNRTQAYAKACDLAGGALLDHVRTTDTVADMESIRRVLGAEQINYYGFSYGTYLGQVYATLHPEKVRRMVLDGNVDPRKVWYDANLDQDVQFDRNMDVFFTWVARNDSAYQLGATSRTVKAKYYDALRKLGEAPAGGKIGPDEWNDIFITAGYYVFGWQQIAAAFGAWVNGGDATPLLSLYAKPGPGTDNGYAMYLATQCSDVSWPKNWSRWQRDNWRIHAQHPFMAWNNAWYNAPCRTWGAKSGTPVRIDGRKIPPILLINETNDAATPYPGAIQVRKLFPRSVLVEGVGGTTHSGSLNGVTCVDDTIAAYLDTGALPRREPGNASDKQCDAVPEPAAGLAALSVEDGAQITRADLQDLIGTR